MSKKYIDELTQKKKKNASNAEDTRSSSSSEYSKRRDRINAFVEQSRGEWNRGSSVAAEDRFVSDWAQRAQDFASRDGAKTYGEYRSQADVASSLLKDYRRASSTLMGNKGLYKNYDPYMDAVRKLGGYLEKSSDYYSAFKNADEFMAYMDSVERQNYLNSFDSSKAQAELDALNKELDERKKYYDGAKKSLGIVGRTKGEDDPLYQGYAKQISDYEAKQARAGELQKDIYDATNLQTLSKYAGYSENADFKEKSVAGETYSGTGLFDTFATKHAYINDKDFARAKADVNAMRAGTADPNAIYSLMKDDEIKVFNYLTAARGKKAALEYLDALSEELNKRQTEKMVGNIEGMEQTTAGKVFGSALSVALAVPKAAGFIGAAIDKGSGKYVSEYSPNLRYSVAQQAMRAEASKDMGEVGSFLYNTGMSILDNAALVAMTGGTPAGQAANLAVMGLGSASDTTLEAIRRGASQNQAFQLGALAGIAEVLFEKVSLDNFIKLSAPGARGAFLKNVLKQAGIEASEEVATEVANIIADNAVMGDLSNYNLAVNAYVSDGMSREEAKKKASIDSFMNVLLAGAGGALSGGVMGVGGQTVGNLRAASIGKNSGIDADALIQAAISMPENSSARELAQRISDGRTKRSNVSIGNLASAYAQEGGDISALMPTSPAPFEDEDPLRRAAYEVAEKKLQGNTQNAEESSMPSKAQIQPVERVPANEAPNASNAVVMPDTAATASDTANAKRAEIGSASEIASKLSSAFSASPELNVYADENGSINIDRNGKSYAKMDEREARAMASSYDGSVNAIDYASGFHAAYSYAARGIELSQIKDNSISVRDLTDAQLYAAYAAGRNVYLNGSASAESTLSARRAAALSPDSTEFHPGVNRIVDDKLSNKQESQIRVLDALGKKYGVEIILDDALYHENGGKQGQHSGDNAFYNPNTKRIHINQNALGEAYLAIGMHELTHYIKDNNAQAYDTLEAFILSALEERGENVQALIDYQMEHNKYSEDVAREEVVANTIPAILNDESYVKRIVEADRTLAERIRDFLREFIDTIKETLRTLEGEASWKQMQSIRQDTELLSAIADVFDAALGETRAKHSKSDSGANSNRFSAKDTEKRAVEHFGKTYSWNETGYITTSGARLDFSGRHEGAPGGYRTVDHRDILDAYGEESDMSGSEAMVDFMAQGNIRVSPEIGGINLSVMPTAAQYEKLEQFVQKYRGEVMLDIDDTDGNTLHSVEYPRNTRASKVLNDIRNYFEKGTVPEVSVTQQFRFSAKDERSASIKQQIAEHQDELNAMKPVAAVESGRRPQRNGKPDRTLMRKSLQAFYGSLQYSVERKGFGKVLFDENAMHNLVEYIQSDAEFAAAKAAPAVVKRGIQADHHVKHKGHSDVESYTFAAPVILNGKRGNVAVVVQYTNRNKPHCVRILMPDGSGFDLGEMIKADQTDSAATIEGGRQQRIESASFNSISESGENSNPRFSLKDASPVDVSALQHENEKLAQSLDVALDQTKLTHGHRVKAGLLGTLAGKTVRDYKSEYSASTLKENLVRIFEFLSSSKNPNMNEVHELGVGLMKAVLEKSNHFDSDGYNAYSKERDYLRNTGIVFSDTQKKEAAALSDTFGKYRSSMFGSVKITNDGVPLDTAWQELSEMNSELFPPDTNASDMPRALMIAHEALKRDNFYVNDFGYDLDSAAADAWSNLLEAYYKSQTFDSGKDKIADLNQKMRDLRNAARKEAKAVEREIIRNAEGHAKEIEKAKRRFERHLDADAVRKYRSRIERTVKELSNMLIRPTDKKHVPEVLRKTVSEFLQTIDFYGDRTSKKALAWRERMRDLKDAMQRAERGDNEFSDYYADIDPDFVPRLEEFIDAGRNVSVVSEMKASQLRELDSIIAALKHTIADANALHENKRYNSLRAVAEASTAEMNQKRAKKPRGKMGEKIDEWLNVGQLDSFSFFDQLGNAAKSILAELRGGFDKNVINIRIAMKYMNGITGDKNVKKQMKTWSGSNAKLETFTLANGRKLSLTAGQIMELYCLNKREQARGHIYGGGIKVKQDSGKAGVSAARVNSTSPAQVTEADMETILASLSDEQRNIADKMQAFLSGTCADWGNEVSLTLYGYKKFTEENYYPIKSDENFTNTNDPEKNGGFYALKNLGMTKATVRKANNPLILGDIFDTFSAHVGDMATYNAFVVPLSDAMKWYNFRSKGGDDGSVPFSVKQSIERIVGKQGQRYFMNLIKDINGVNSGSYNLGISDAMLRNAKTAAVGFNVRVVLQQPTAYFRAAAEISPKYLTAAVFSKNGFEKALQYCQIAQWKAWGYYDMNIGRSMKDVIIGYESGIEKIRNASMWAAGKADERTWGTLWNACELEIKAKNKALTPGTEAFNKAVGARLSEIIDRTQVVDTVFHRSQFMRSKNGLTQLYTSFMSEPTKSYNMLRNAVVAVARDKNKASVARLARTVSTYIVTSIATAAAAAIADAFRDDDDEKKWIEKYFDTFMDNALDNLNPFNLIPIAKDIVSMLDGFNPSRLDMQGLSKLVSVGRAWEKYLTGESKWPLYKLIYKTAEAASYVTGIPVGNLMRSFNSLYNTFIDSTLMWDTSTRTKAAFKNALLSEDDEAAEAAIADYIKQANADYQKKYAKDMPEIKSKAKVNSWVKDIVKDCYTAGELTKKQAENALREYGGVDDSKAMYGMFDSWDFENAKDDLDDSDYPGIYDDMFSAMRSGSSISSYVDELTANGYEEDSVSSTVRQRIREWYQDKAEDGRSRISKDQAKTMLKKYSDLDDDEVSALVEKWTCYVVTGIDYDGIADAFQSDKITANRAKDMMMKYGGLSSYEASIRVSAFEFRKNNPEFKDAKEETIAKYTEYCEPYGVTPNEYFSFRDSLPKYDSDGNGSFKQSEVEDALRAMPGLTDAKRAQMWQSVNKKWKNNPFR